MRKIYIVHVTVSMCTHEAQRNTQTITARPQSRPEKRKQEEGAGKKQHLLPERVSPWRSEAVSMSGGVKVCGRRVEGGSPQHSVGRGGGVVRKSPVRWWVSSGVCLWPGTRAALVFQSSARKEEPRRRGGDAVPSLIQAMPVGLKETVKVWMFHDFSVLWTVFKISMLHATLLAYSHLRLPEAKVGRTKIAKCLFLARQQFIYDTVARFA